MTTAEKNISSFSSLLLANGKKYECEKICLGLSLLDLITYTYSDGSKVFLFALRSNTFKVEVFSNVDINLHSKNFCIARKIAKYFMQSEISMNAILDFATNNETVNVSDKETLDEKRTNKLTFSDGSNLFYQSESMNQISLFYIEPAK